MPESIAPNAFKLLSPKVKIFDSSIVAGTRQHKLNSPMGHFNKLIRESKIFAIILILLNFSDKFEDC